MKAERFSHALGAVRDSYIEEALKYKKNYGKRLLAKGIALAACLVLLLAICRLLTPFRLDSTITVYAHGTREEITAAGAVVSTGTISDNGEMKGKPLMFYLSGEDIATVRFSCKNQQIRFMDWTEKREEYGNASNFTVVYGEDEDEYDYLTIDWTPEATIRELTDNPSSTIAGLPEDMRRDIIVLEITFADGRTAAKAIRISLLEDGTFFASFDDYQISAADAFVKRPDALPIPRDILYAQDSETVAGIADAAPMVYVNGILYRQSPKQTCYEEKKESFLYLGKVLNDVTNAQHNTNGVPEENFQANHPIVGAEIYQYENCIAVLINGKYWLYEPLETEGAAVLDQEGQTELSPEEKMLLNPEEGVPAAENGSSWDADLNGAEEAARAYYANTVFEIVSLKPESQEEDTITFSVTVKKGGVVQEPERRITLQRNQDTWEVTNEGY